MENKFATYEIESEIKEQGYKYIVGVDEVGRGCEKIDAEVLTVSGWKYYNELSVDDMVLSYTNNDTIEWQKISNIIIKDFKGKLLEMSNRTINIKVTPDHYFDVLRRTFRRDRNDNNKLKMTGLKFRGRKGVLDLSDNDFIPRGGEWCAVDVDNFILPSVKKHKYDHSGKDYGEKLIPMDLWLKFLGIYLSEGHTSYKKGASYVVGITQIKKDTCEEIFEMCSKLPFDVKRTKKGIVIYNKQLYSYLNVFGKCYDKFIPNDIKNLSKRQLNILIEWLIKGDGTCYTGRNRKEVCVYYTTSNKLRNDFEEILLKAGWTFSTTIRKPRDRYIRGRKIRKENCVPCFEIRLKRNKSSHVKYLKISKEFYKGKVFCISLPIHHNFYVRRDGTGYFTGNCGSGPVVAAAVYIPDDVIPELLLRVKDSKKLSEKKREELFPIIMKTCDVGFGVVSNKVIDDINILNATKAAMEEAISNLKFVEYVMIDGPIELKGINIPQMKVIKGDSKSISIAAASIVAKVTRDRTMKELHEIWSFYGFDRNKGYLTKEHVNALRTYGPCEVHRKTFNKVREYCDE